MLEFIKQVFGFSYTTNQINLQFKWLIFIPIIFVQLWVHWRCLKSFTNK